MRQHRDTPDNNADTPFDFTPENSKMARRLCACAGTGAAESNPKLFAVPLCHIPRPSCTPLSVPLPLNRCRRF